MTWARSKGLLFFALLFAALSLLPLLFLPHLPLTVIENDKEVTPFALLFSSFSIALAFWVVLPVLSPALLFALASVTGGAISNLFYRLFIGPVPDYIPLPANYFANLADFFIVLGVLAYAVLVLRALRRERAASSCSSLERRLFSFGGKADS